MLLSCFILLSYAPLSRISAPPTALAADPTAPNFLRDMPDLNGRIEDATAWTIGGGYLYWAHCSLVGGSGYLRSWPIRGGLARTLQSSNFCNTGNWAADETGLYYWNSAQIVRLSPGISTPFVEQLIAPSTQPSGAIILNNGTVNWRDYIFWIANNTLYSANRYTHRQLAAPEPLGASAHDLRFIGDSFYWFADGVLYKALTACLGFGGGACAREVVANENGTNLLDTTQVGPLRDTSYAPFWTNVGALRSIWCRPNGTGLGKICSPSTSYAAPAGVTLGAPASNGSFLFWVQNSQNCVAGFCSWSNGGSLMKWSLRPTLTDTPQPIACENCLGTYAIANVNAVQTADGWVYFDSTAGISRIRADAPTLAWDLAADSMEVTQGIQNLANDVPLVAHKPTYVRFYGRKLSGPTVRGISAQLSVYTIAGTLIGTLRPLNTLDFAANNVTPDRSNARVGWTFQLPDAWIAGGAISLQPTILATGSDTNRANDSLPMNSFTFSDKAPICIVTAPMRTMGPAASNDDASIARMVAMARQLMPVHDVWVYQQSSPVQKYEYKNFVSGQFNGPGVQLAAYTLPADQDEALLDLNWRSIITDDLPACSRAGAITHMVGLVSAQTNTTNAGITNLGYSYTPNNAGDAPQQALYVKLVSAQTMASVNQDWTTQDFNTLAHELSHNYGRRHVNCGGPKNPDMQFPYIDGAGTNCVIDNGWRVIGALPTQIPPEQRYYGFDTASRTPIDPNTVADYMSYSSTFWVSDYTWRAIFDKLRTDAPGQAEVGMPQSAAAAPVLVVSGLLPDGQAPASLRYAWNYSGAALSPGIAQAMQQYAATPFTASGKQLAAGAYHVQLIDVDGSVIDDVAITPLAAADGDSNAFLLTLPSPTDTVARIDLLDGVHVIAQIEAGPNAPNVQVISPAAGEVIDNHLTVSWRASDLDQGDTLLFNADYSPDAGQTWSPLLTNIVANPTSNLMSIDLSDLSSLPQSDSALIRVVASDGLHTTISTSAAFSVLNRAPMPRIEAPGAQQLEAGQPILLSGSATDPEDGGIAGDTLTWSIDGVVIGGEAQVEITGLAPGQHTLTLTAYDSAGKEGSATRTISVAPLGIPQVTAPTLDGVCSDDAYVGAPQILLAPYADGSRASVRLVRSADTLWACFSGMPRTRGASAGTIAALHIDVNRSQDTQIQAGDLTISLGENGALELDTGTGASAPAASDAGGQVSADGDTWAAELRIDAALLGGWDHSIGLSAEQINVDTTGDSYSWPLGSLSSSPSTWATAALGTLAQVDQITPNSAPAGAGDTPITIVGNGFASDALVFWDGVACPTTFVSATELQAVVPSTFMAAATSAQITVATSGMQGVDSGPLTFTVANPTPSITAIELEGSTLILRGAGFIAGTRVIIDGDQRAATVIGSAQMQIALSNAELRQIGNAKVAVFNDGPGGGVSNIVSLTGGVGMNRIFLPMVTR
jgi:hypothetical protein